MLNVTDLRAGTVFKEAGQIFQVLSYDHIKMGRGSGNIKVKVKNLKNGSTVEKSFITGARVEEAQIEKKTLQFLYHSGDPKTGHVPERYVGEFNFMDPVSFEQFLLPSSVLGDQARFLKDEMEVTLIISAGEALSLELPASLIYEVTEAGPREKGNTISNVYKSVTLENGMEIRVPMFIKTGDKVKIDTRTGQYVERAK